MTLSFVATPPPLTVDPDGAVRVGKTRVTLDTVVRAFHDGATAEEIAQQYPSLALADVYAVIGYYLQRRGEEEEYLRERQRRAAEVHGRNESRFDPDGVRAGWCARPPDGAAPAPRLTRDAAACRRRKRQQRHGARPAPAEAGA